MKLTSEMVGNITGRLQAAGILIGESFGHSAAWSGPVEKHMREAQRALILAINEVQKIQRERAVTA